jgi:hypothetical protein
MMERKQPEQKVSADRPLPIIDAGANEDFDPWAGWDDPNLPPHPKVSVETLAVELRKILRYGLPLTQRKAGAVLPNLRSVIARSVHPYDPQSRVDSLNRLLVRILVDLDEADDPTAEATATRVIFGIAKGAKGLRLTERHQRAASVLSYDTDHFRKHIQPRLLEEVAAVLYRDLLRYKRRIRRGTLSEEPTGDTPSITEQDFTHEEELISRIWQHVYGWRAELIACARFTAMDGYETHAEDHSEAAQRQERAVRGLAAEYVASYGERLLRHGQAEYDIDAILRLATPMVPRT